MIRRIRMRSFFSWQMRKKGWGGVEQFPSPSFCPIRGGVMMLRADHVDTMFKVAAGPWTNQDQKRLVRFCHAIKYRNRDEWDFLEKCNLTRQKVCITHISLTDKLWKGLLTTSSQFFVSCLICNQGAPQNISFRPKISVTPTTINIRNIPLQARNSLFKESSHYFQCHITPWWPLPHHHRGIADIANVWINKYYQDIQ